MNPCVIESDATRSQLQGSIRVTRFGVHRNPGATLQLVHIVRGASEPKVKINVRS
jgi:hypothetical protein